MLAARCCPPRRALLLSGVAAVGAGCDLSSGGEGGPTAPVTSGAPVDPTTETDLVLLSEARDLVGAALARVGGVRREVPELRSPLGPLRRLHAAHLEVLDAAGPSPTEAVASPVPVQGDAARALRDLRRHELGLQRRLATMAVEAASGPFARLLASMSAAVAGHLVVLQDARGRP